MTAQPPPDIQINDLSAWHGAAQILHSVNLTCPEGRVTAVIGATGAGKSTLLRLINRLNDDIPQFQHQGQVLVGGEDVLAPNVDPVSVRRRVGMLFERPAPFPTTVFQNVAFGLRVSGDGDPHSWAARVMSVLRRVELWNEVSDLLHESVERLSPGQQQRLCFARALIIRPDVLLLDQPTSVLDTESTSRLEQLILSLRKVTTVVLVTQDVQQAGRLADITAFMENGRVVEVGRTGDLFTNPRQPATQAYLSRRF